MKKKIFISFIVTILFVTAGTSLVGAKFWGSDCHREYEAGDTPNSCGTWYNVCTDYVFWIPMKPHRDYLSTDCSNL